MPEPIRYKTQLGITDFEKRLEAAGLHIVEQYRTQGLQRSTRFAIGTSERHTTITISDTFLDDLPATRDYHAIVDSYARAVAGRLKCGSPELFYCSGGVAVEVSIQWPIQGGAFGDTIAMFMLTQVVRQPDGHIANCSIQLPLGRTTFQLVIEATNSLRAAIDLEQIKFYEPMIRQERYQRVEHQQSPLQGPPQGEIEQFVAGKACVLGFLAVEEPSDVWVADPWDAQYLGVAVKELTLAMRVLRANGSLRAGIGPEYASPTDKLLAEHSSRAKKEVSFSLSQQKLSRTSLPNKDDLLRDMQDVLEQHLTSALIVIDLDNFKTVNDTKSHSEGDVCLDKVITTIGVVVGRKGKIYRWGSGDEFIVCLPDFSTAEALATAERVRSTVEHDKPGGDISVTTSIGVCGTDSVESRSPEEILDFADKAMYESKHKRGKNCVTAWPLSSSGGTAATPTQRLSQDERQKLADAVLVSVKTNNGQNRHYTISVKNHSKKFELVVNSISLWSDGQRVSAPVFREAANWTVHAEGEIPINFDAGQDVSHRLWILAGAPPKTSYVIPRSLPGHFEAKVRVDITYEILEVEKTYSETGMVQVDLTNHAITGL